MIKHYVPRLLDGELSDVLTCHPAVLIVGPRAWGKTTTARRLCRSVIRLDIPAQAAAVQADPDSALRNLDEPVLIDEWQLMPEIIGAVKRSVDDDPRPGRFVLTGSSQADLTESGWPATGRIVRLTMYPLVGRERHGDVTEESLIDRVLSEGTDALAEVTSTWDLRDYLTHALTSGWPEALRAPHERARDRWLTAYVDHLVTREVPSMGISKDPVKLRRYLQALAANTAGIPTHKLLHDSAGITRQTALGFDDLFDSVLLTQRVPAWSSGPTERAVRLPKRYVTDPGLAAAILRADSRRIMRDADLLGRIIDTLVAAQLRAECTISTMGADLFHLRDTNGRREVDLVIEARDGSIIAVEVKAAATATVHDARHLVWLRQQMGNRFVAGFLVHTGPRAVRFEDRILGVPISGLWSR
jgi:uncharacterized protein